MNTSHKVVFGDSRIMHELNDNSIHLIITSPPYWQLKDYGNSNQIGFNDSYEEYINNLNLVWNECNRVLKNGCRLCINIGDQFARSIYYGRYKVIPIRTEIIRFCETVGLDYMGAIIWQKSTTMNTTGGATIMGSYPYPRNGIIKIDYEFILIFRKLGDSPAVSKEYKEKSRLSKEEWNQFFSGHWYFNGVRQEKHLAMFPEELPKRLIKMFSFVGDTILDPFLGSGTTTLAAMNLGRNSIGYEINSDFKNIIIEKVGAAQNNLFDNADFEIITRNENANDYSNIKITLPYVFRDPIKITKLIDPKKIGFGSKIDSATPTKTNGFSVKQIISPSVLLLDTGVIIRLIGIRVREDKREDALNYLKSKLAGQKVFMKFDQMKYDDSNNLLCYLYLKNKTFINLHLLKNKLVYVDESFNYKYLLKFRQIGEQPNG